MMKLPRRKFFRLAAGAAALSFAPSTARAQAYPSRPVRIVVGFPAGGATDIGARLIGQWLSERLGQPFVIENKPGAGTHAATEFVARAPADGYTLLMATGSNAINATLYERMSYNFLRDRFGYSRQRDTGNEVLFGTYQQDRHLAFNSFGHARCCERR